MKNKRLKELVIPDDITSMGNCVFADCENLKSISLPAHLKVEKLDAPLGCRVIRRKQDA